MLFEEYDNAIITAALKHIAAGLRMREQDLPLYLSVIRFGAVPAFVLIPLADRLGRRPVFIASVVGMGLLTFATAFSQTTAQFVVLQALTRTFFITYSAVAYVIITEEFPAAHRGFGVGMLAALGAIGAGLGAAMFSRSIACRSAGARCTRSASCRSGWCRTSCAACPRPRASCAPHNPPARTSAPGC